MSYRYTAPPAYPDITPAMNGVGAYYGTQPLEPVKGLGEFEIQKALSVASFVSSAALAYHGYRRSKSVWSAIGWAIAGSLAWPIAVPVALAQGFGKAK